MIWTDGRIRNQKMSAQQECLALARFRSETIVQFAQVALVLSAATFTWTIAHNRKESLQTEYQETLENYLNYSHEL